MPVEGESGGVAAEHPLESTEGSGEPSPEAMPVGAGAGGPVQCSAAERPVPRTAHAWPWAASAWVVAMS